MAGVNKVIIVGRLGADPETRTFGNGGKVVNLRVATSETWKDKGSGERKERTEWHTVVIHNEPLGKIAEQYLSKGSEVYLEGQLETRKWEKDGVERYSTEVVMRPYNSTLTLIGGRSEGGGGRDRDDDRGGRSSGGRDDRGGGSRGGNSGGGGRARNLDLDDDIPFAAEFR